ncbi:hypothetical protein LUZ61_014240 [Rhynchospora tenuis]|uniref:F-box domain-containing protein n=1 Tax=Rhynchospora tenuis TaxID=198213 RepID=A0AAD5WAB1_9POAL|nr:hypothetical protein LUZ61_014240 [Rhynchospora tenuis]
MMSGVDRISALPEEIKLSILSRLPITDAVRTSALSQSWRHLWTLLSGFHADLDSERGPIRLPENVDRILSSLRGPIRHFSLRYILAHYEPSRLQHFLDLIFQRDALWNLSVYCFGTLRRTQLPFFLSLKELHLNFVEISLPSGFRGFEQLTSLKLHLVSILQQDIQSLIDGSKKLTSVELLFASFMAPQDSDSEPPRSVTFDCPLLKYLSFHFGGLHVEPKIVSVPCLESADVAAGNGSISFAEDLVWFGEITLKFLADVAHISNLTLNFDVLLCLSRLDVPHTLRVRFQQLRCLKLVVICLTLAKGCSKRFVACLEVCLSLKGWNCRKPTPLWRRETNTLVCREREREREREITISRERDGF